jgi:hypothetical protein
MGMYSYFRFVTGDRAKYVRINLANCERVIQNLGREWQDFQASPERKVSSNSPCRNIDC